MVVFALILLALVAVFCVAIVVSPPEFYDLSLFGALIPVNTTGVFVAGAAAMLVALVALGLLRMGLRRSRAKRKELKTLRSNAPAATRQSPAASGRGATPAPESAAPRSSAPAVTGASGRSATPASTPPGTHDGPGSRTTAAERQAMLDETDALTREDRGGTRKDG